MSLNLLGLAGITILGRLRHQARNSALPSIYFLRGSHSSVIYSSADSCRNIHIYAHWPYHNDSIIETDARRKRQEGRTHEGIRTQKEAGRKTQEDFFRKIFTSQFIARVRKGCSRFACERVMETEHKLHILTPLL